MVSLALPDEERKVHGQFTQRVLAQSRTGDAQISWVQRTSPERTEIRKSALTLDSEGLSWVDSVESEQKEQHLKTEKLARRVTNENHREMTGAEAPDQATPKLKPLFGKSPTGKHTKAYLNAKAEPKSFIAALMN